MGPFLTSLSLLASLAAAPADANDAILVSGVSIVAVEGGEAVGPSDILIQNGRIAQIAPAGTLDAAGASVIDGRGKYALPGLIDVHAHIGDGGAGAQNDAQRDRAVEQFLRYGVTTIFVPGGTGGNDDELGRWRERCRAREIACPGLYGSGALITAHGSHPLSTIFDLPDDADPALAYVRGVTALRPDDDIDALVATKRAKGIDAIKIVIEDGPPPWYPKPRLSDAQIASLAHAAHAKGLPVFAHVSAAAHVEAGLAGGIDAIMHAPVDRLADGTLAEMARRGTFFVATLALYDGIQGWTSGRVDTDPYALSGVAPEALETLSNPGFLAAAPGSREQAGAYVAAAADNVVRAARAGVPIALGTDTNNPFVYPGYAVHEELALLVEAGLTPRQALLAATKGAAAFLHRQDSLGRIAEGYEADLLLLDGDPLVDIRNLRGIDTILSDGRVVANIVSAAE